MLCGKITGAAPVFGRIVKEHALFLRAGFTPADPSFSEKAEYYQKEFENLLCEAVSLSDGIVGKEVLGSGEVITEFTALAEKQTECFTGIPISKEITRKTQGPQCGERQCGNAAQMRGKVRRLNRTGLKLLDGLISFKENILKRVLQCEMFTLNYPLLIEHILREAKLYRRYIEILEREGDLREQTLAFRDFKAAGTQGIQQCKIRSVILPLLADHVLREANHYLRLLRCECS